MYNKALDEPEGVLKWKAISLLITLIKNGFKGCLTSCLLKNLNMYINNQVLFRCYQVVFLHKVILMLLSNIVNVCKITLFMYENRTNMKLMSKQNIINVYVITKVALTFYYIHISTKCMHV